MGDARSEILGRIRSAIGESAGPAFPVSTYRRHGSLSPSERTALFCERIADYRATVHRTGDVLGAVRQVVSGRIGVSPAFPEVWRPSGVELVDAAALSPAELDRLDGVLTGCRLAIAETGTIVLVGDRAMTLVPDLHVCVVRSEQIVETVPEAIELLAREQRALTLVSGPSATSDIELSRVEGVHGPRRLVAIVCA